MRNDIVTLDSINYCTPDHAARVVVSGSHGGLYSAYKAVFCRVRGVLFNDAGKGKNSAGTAALVFCQNHGLPVAVIGHDSARIGDARDMLVRGSVSQCNPAAGKAGVMVGMPCAGAAELLRMHQETPVWRTLEAMDEYRHEIVLPGTDEAIVCIDSASLIMPADAGRLVVTGSHGGLIGGDPAKAINVAARFAAFNDAGFGMNDAGAGRLEPLALQGIAAVVVSHASAEIGNGRSTLYDGIISRANAVAEKWGCQTGMKLTEALSARIARVNS
jgi:nucleotidyltransferase/DNA polymerase involved in DNA repair